MDEKLKSLLERKKLWSLSNFRKETMSHKMPTCKFIPLIFILELFVSDIFQQTTPSF